VGEDPDLARALRQDEIRKTGGGGWGPTPPKKPNQTTNLGGGTSSQSALQLLQERDDRRNGKRADPIKKTAISSLAAKVSPTEFPITNKHWSAQGPVFFA